MVFGLHGSQLLVKVANTLINPVDKKGTAKSTFSKKKMPKVELPKPSSITGMFGSLAEGLKNTAINTFQNGPSMNDEL